MNQKRIKVAVAMSGGVDSSVSAWMLKNQGYETEGFYMELGCGSSDDAEKMANMLKIPFSKVNMKKVFEREVMKYFISEYKSLRTPNPCVICNKMIKFGWLLDIIRKKRYDRIATGHYARIEKDRDGVYHLLSGKDANKDQSYFLYRLNQRQLSRVIFPLGETTKASVKEMAGQNGLPISEKGESQEVCFLGDQDYRQFLRKKLSKTYFLKGDIVNMSGDIVGRHEGLVNYTIGQRRGINQLGIKDENKRPLYVVGFDKRVNRLIVGTDEDIFKKEAAINKLSWVSALAKKKALRNTNIKAKIRYRHTPAECQVKIINQSKIRVTFQEPQRAVVPGQSLVFYSGEEVLGGGIIV